MSKVLIDLYQTLYSHFGPQYWWPADDDLEIIVGAILTQAVSWSNVERALANLRAANALELHRLQKLPQQRLARLIRPAGYYNEKARKLKAMVDFLNTEYTNSLSLLFSQPLSKLRPQLLTVYGVGPETADTILLYAGNYPTFVIDAYTRRILARLEYGPRSGYEQLRRFFLDHLPPDPQLYNEYHALLVRLGKEYCHKKLKKAQCSPCPLGECCPAG